MEEVGKLSKQKKFGLVFEEHLPECTPLYDVEIRRDSKVALKAGQVSDIYIVRSIGGNKAICEYKWTTLQRSGFKRDSTEYIRGNADKCVRGTPDNPKLLLKKKNALLKCPNELVRRDTEEIQYNVPELFIDEGEE